MPDHRLGRGDRKLCGMRAEHFLDRAGFSDIVRGGSGTVGVHILNIAGIELAVRQRAFDGAHHAALIWRGEVLGVGAHAEADDLGQDGGAARLRRLQRLEHDHRGALAEHHAAAVLRERAADIRRHHPHRLPRPDGPDGDAGLRAAGDRATDHAGPHHVEREADGMGRRCAGAGDREGRTAQPAIHRDLAGGRIRHQLRDRERMNPRHVLLVDAPELIVVRGLPAGAGADDRCGTLRQAVREIETGLHDRFAGRNDRKLRYAVQHGELTFVEMLRRIEILNFRGDFLVQLFRKRNCDVCDSRQACFNAAQ